MIIGLGGRKRSGKSTVADYIIKTRGAKQYAFADGVRGIALSWYGHIIPDESYLRANKDKPLSDQFNEFPYSQCYLLSVPYWDNLDKNKRGVRTGRDLLKAIGDFGRDACPDIWTQILFDQLDEETEPTDLIVIDDVRMPDERARIRESGGLLVLLRRGDDEVVDEHWSETSLGEVGEYDAVFTAPDGGCAVLEEMAEHFLTEHGL
jgi:hypothetical protein